jgi:hypothetical protein
MTEKTLIVPVKLDRNPSNTKTKSKTKAACSQSKTRISSQIACSLKINDIEVQFYNNADPIVLQTIMAEVGKYAH